MVDRQVLIAFEQNQQPTLQLQGSTLQLSDLKLNDTAGQALAGWNKLSIEVGDTRPLQQQVRLASATLQQPFGYLHRRADGGFLPAPVAVKDGVQEAVATAPSAVAADKSENIAAKAEWKLAIDRFNVESGWANWRDDVGQVGAALRVDQFTLHAQNLAWPMDGGARWQLAAQLQGEDRAARGMVHSRGQGGVESGQASVVVDKFDAQAVHAYARQWLQLPIEGLASLSAGVAWQGGRVHAVINQAARPGDGRAITGQLQQVLNRFVHSESGLPMRLIHMGDIPADKAVREAVMRRQLLIQASPGCAASLAIAQLANRIKTMVTPVQQA